jgi:hypothetical protein
MSLPSTAPPHARNPAIAPLSLVAALVLAALASWPRANAVWTTGAYFDSDDAMRMVQVRDLLAGQGWFDMTARRLDPTSGGVFMHWSRIVDAPLAALVKFFGLLFAPEQAERAARLAFPLALQGLLYFAAGTAARALLGGKTVLPAIVMMFLGGVMFGQFQPGRIDHHAPQIVLLMAATGAMIAAMDMRRPRWAMAAGALLALSMAISLENLHFIAIFCAAPALVFVARGAQARPLLLSFALGLGVGALAFYAASVAPRRWGEAYCDALSAPQMTLVAGVVVALASLAALSGKFPTPFARFVAAAFAGAAALGVYIAAYPACLGDPLAATDPLVRELWLSRVHEAMSLRKLAVRDLGEAAMLAAPTLFGLTAACGLAWRTDGEARARWLFLAALVAVGFAVGAWQIRAFSSVLPLAGLAWVGGALALAERGRARHELLGGPLALALLLMLASPFVWALGASESEAAPGGAPGVSKAACLASERIAALDALPPGLALTAIDLGPYLLERTRHSTLAGPYHRDNHGNRAALEIWTGPAESAAPRLRALGVRYVFFCPGLIDDARDAPQGSLAAVLRDKAPPAGLRPQPLAAGPLATYVIAAE